MRAGPRTSVLLGWLVLVPLLAHSGEGEHAVRLGQLLSSQTGVPTALSDTPVRMATSRRAEAYAEQGDRAFAGILLITDGSIPPATARNLGESACRFVFVRQVLAGLDTEWVNPAVQQPLLNTVVGINSGEFEFVGFRRLQGSVEEGAIFQTCSAPLSALERARAAVVRDNTVGVAAYQLGKDYLRRGERSVALTLFKQSRTAPSVYPNALAFMIPLLWDEAPEIAATLEQEYLKLERMTDAAAAAFLASEYIARGDQAHAEAMYRVCIAIDPTNRHCQAELERLFRLPPWENKTSAPDDPLYPEGLVGSDFGNGQVDEYKPADKPVE